MVGSHRDGQTLCPILDSMEGAIRTCHTWFSPQPLKPCLSHTHPPTPPTSGTCCVLMSHPRVTLAPSQFVFTTTSSALEPSQCLSGGHDYSCNNQEFICLVSHFLPSALHHSTNTHTHTRALPSPFHTHTTCADACMHARTHKHTHTQIHAPPPPPPPPLSHSPLRVLSAGTGWSCPNPQAHAITINTQTICFCLNISNTGICIYMEMWRWVGVHVSGENGRRKSGGLLTISLPTVVHFGWSFLPKSAWK